MGCIPSDFGLGTWGRWQPGLTRAAMIALMSPSAQKGNGGTDGYVLAQVLERGHGVPNTNAGLLDSLSFHVPYFGIDFRAVDENSGTSLPPHSLCISTRR